MTEEDLEEEQQNSSEHSQLSLESSLESNKKPVAFSSFPVTYPAKESPIKFLPKQEELLKSEDNHSASSSVPLEIEPPKENSK